MQAILSSPGEWSEWAAVRAISVFAFDVFADTSHHTNGRSISTTRVIVLSVLNLIFFARAPFGAGPLVAECIEP